MSKEEHPVIRHLDRLHARTPEDTPSSGETFATRREDGRGDSREAPDASVRGLTRSAPDKPGPPGGGARGEQTGEALLVIKSKERERSPTMPRDGEGGYGFSEPMDSMGRSLHEMDVKDALVVRELAGALYRIAQGVERPHNAAREVLERFGFSTPIGEPSVEKDDEGRPYQCGAFVASDSRWECRLESDHAGDHEWQLRGEQTREDDPLCNTCRGRNALVANGIWCHHPECDRRPRREDVVRTIERALRARGEPRFVRTVVCSMCAMEDDEPLVCDSPGCDNTARYITAEQVARGEPSEPTGWVVVETCSLWAWPTIGSLHPARADAEETMARWRRESGDLDGERDYFVAAVLTAGEPGEAIGWRPIESAPKDGTTILAWWYWEPNDAVTVRWDDDYRSWVDTSREIYHPPSHWMPLPDPPAVLTPTESGDES